MVQKSNSDKLVIGLSIFIVESQTTKIVLQ